ncbi:hypothetical protein JHK85_010341 [Glycine max]|nr:hypothetical protein JHK85_010341 [Glycine max]
MEHLQHWSTTREVAKSKIRRHELGSRTSSDLWASESSNSFHSMAEFGSMNSSHLGKNSGITSSIILVITWSDYDSEKRMFSRIPATLAHVEALEAYTQISSHPFHKTNKQDIISLDILYSKVTSVKFVAQGESFLTASANKIVCLWQGSDDGNYNCRHILKDHSAERSLGHDRLRMLSILHRSTTQDRRRIPSISTSVVERYRLRLPNILRWSSRKDRCRMMTILRQSRLKDRCRMLRILRWSSAPIVESASPFDDVPYDDGHKPM